MIQIEYKTLADATGTKKVKSRRDAELWLASFSSPSGFHLSLTDDIGALVGRKDFGEPEISWCDGVTTPPKTKRLPRGIKCKSTMVTLDAGTIEVARELGGGNLSRGIRMAVALQRKDKSV